MSADTRPLTGRELHPPERRRREWLQASIEVTRGLLSPAGEEPLPAVARAVNGVAGADLTLVVLPTDTGERLRIADRSR